MASQYFAAVGRRKSAVARVRLFPGEEGFVINGKSAADYFVREGDLQAATQPLVLTGTESNFRISVLVKGGGVTGQAGAVRHAVARALLEVDPDFRPVLKGSGMLTRDPRAKERKKPGLKRARKAPQYTKR